MIAREIIFSLLFAPTGPNTPARQSVPWAIFASVKKVSVPAGFMWAPDRYSHGETRHYMAAVSTPTPTSACFSSPFVGRSHPRQGRSPDPTWRSLGKWPIYMWDRVPLVDIPLPLVYHGEQLAEAQYGRQKGERESEA
jgi:hypothetical protein